MPNPGHPDTRPPGILKQEPFHDQCASPSSVLGLNYSVSPRSTPKSVSIAPRAEAISPLILGKQKSIDELNFECERGPRKPQVKGPNSRRLLGRPGNTGSPTLRPTTSSFDRAATSDDKEPAATQSRSKHVDHLIDQVSSWIKEERAKRARRKQGKHHRLHRRHHTRHREAEGHDDGARFDERRGSDVSDDSLDLNKLENIIKHTLSLEHSSSRKSSLRHRSSLKRLSQRKPSTASSDTEYYDGDILVPSSDAVLDNSQTLAYTGGASDSADELSGDELAPTTSYRDQDAWAKFKFEIVRLAHTLRLQGWRRVPMDMSGQISVERLSGALTNAVYVVSPPSALPQKKDSPTSESGAAHLPRKLPPKLLLRIYGAQVEHLINRETELQILRRLARKRIGPRMLGTFANGRFEEYFNAKTLTPEDIRNPDTSIQIAKRMRELHDGIELLDGERDAGAFVWRNWDKWVQRVEQVVSWLDHEVMAMEPGAKPTGQEAWMRRGLTCGVEWKRFRQAVEKYRDWLDAQYGGPKKLREHLVFAHNDAQYGNILRLMPPDESPLLLPPNTHKQLIVIDFEYANANLPGLEFANHFTEWCYNYHDERKPYACNTTGYPTPEEQERFIRAYVRHRPQFNVSTPRMTPMSPAISASAPSEQPRRPTSSISDFMLDARNPYFPAQPQPHDESTEKVAEDAEVSRLLHETRIWRLANTAQWVAWGIVQAKVPGLPDSMSVPLSTQDKENPGDQAREELGVEAEEDRESAREQLEEEKAEEQEEEFDYLGYAQHRAMFFWGDALQLGIVKADDLLDEVKAKVKTVPY